MHAELTAELNVTKDGLKFFEKIYKKPKTFAGFLKAGNNIYFYISNSLWLIGTKVINKIEAFQNNKINITSFNTSSNSITFQYTSSPNPKLNFNLENLFSERKTKLVLPLSNKNSPEFSYTYTVLIRNLPPNLTIFLPYFEIVNNFFLKNHWLEAKAQFIENGKFTFFTTWDRSIFALIANQVISF
jgi:hypothetical protein